MSDDLNMSSILGTNFIEVNAHKMVSDICVEMASLCYEELARDNKFYRKNPQYRGKEGERRFILHCAPTLRFAARQYLTERLNSPLTPPEQRDLIFDALLKDATVPTSAKSGAE